MNDDFVSLLREDFCDYGQWKNSCTPEGKCPCCLAADMIETLQSEIDGLKAEIQRLSQIVRY